MKDYYFILFLVLVLSALTPAQLDAKFTSFITANDIMGLSVQITQKSNTIYKGNFGFRDFDRKLLMTNSTSVRMASLSKSMTTSGLFLLIQQGKVKLTDSINQLLGFNITNPFFPQVSLTVQMVLSHQSGLLQCSVYDNFLIDTDLAVDGTKIPALKDFFTVNGKYYNVCSFDKNHVPGTHFSYGNINYIIIGNVIQKLTNTRFDVWMRNNLLTKIGYLSYNPADLPDINNLAVLYAGLNKNWYPTHDNYKGNYKPKNLTGYIPGTNAAIYGPHAHVRATIDELSRYINMLREKGIVNKTIQILKKQSIEQIVRPRYQYHGQIGGSYSDLHAYGLGIYTTSYYPNDNILKNRVTIGHTGSGYGLISGYFYSGDFAFTYVVNGILNGYTYNDEKIYQVQRQQIHTLIDQFITQF